MWLYLSEKHDGFSHNVVWRLTQIHSVMVLFCSTRTEKSLYSASFDQQYVRQMVKDLNNRSYMKCANLKMKYMEHEVCNDGPHLEH